MPPPFAISDEKAVLSGRFLRVSFATPLREAVGELRGNAGEPVAVAPALALVGTPVAAFDLSRVPPDDGYWVAIRVGDALHRFGRSIADQAEALAAGGPRKRKVAASTYEAGGKTFHATLYVDVRRSELRLRLSEADDIDAFLASAETSPAGRTGPPRYSIILSVYNVERYLDDCFNSLVSQTLDFESNMEIVAVDDGSTDGSAKVLERWRSRFPNNIRIHSKRNGGLSSARNAGMARATGEWITFIDPDDFVDRFYFEEVDRAVRSRAAESIALVSCNLIYFHEADGRFLDTHPLRQRFLSGPRSVPVDDIVRDIQPNVASVFFPRKWVVDAGLEFDERVRPGGEDTHFVGRYLLGAGGADAVILPGATYFYRQRADHSSNIQIGPTRPERYDDQLRYGLLNLFREAKAREGLVRRLLQNTALYQLSFQVSFVIGNAEALGFLDDRRRRLYKRLLDDLFADIDASTIAAYDIGGVPFLYPVGLLNLFKDADPPFGVVEVTRVERDNRLVHFRSWSRRSGDRCAFEVNGITVDPDTAVEQRLMFFDHLFAYQTAYSLPFHGGTLRARSVRSEMRIEVNGRRYDGEIEQSTLHRVS